MKKILKWTAIIMLAIIVLLIAIPKQKANGNKQTDIKEQPKAATNDSKSSKESTWSYNYKVDKMDNDTAYFAQVSSLNTINFAAPYDGGSTFMLTVRKEDGKNEVYLQVSKGQFIDNISEERNVRIKFDDAKPIQASYSGTSDYNSTVIFLNSPALIIPKIKKAKHIIIEAEFYQEGFKQIEFNTEGLEWHH